MLSLYFMNEFRFSFGQICIQMLCDMGFTQIYIVIE